MWKAVKLKILVLGLAGSAYGQCNQAACPDMGNDYTCGVVLRNITDGDNVYHKCGYMTRIVGKYSALSDKCKAIGGEDGTKTGNLLSIFGNQENEIMTYHIRNATAIPNTNPQSFYYPWAFIGLRKNCQDCTWFWEDGAPFTFNNWYTGEPSPTYNECGWVRVTLPHFGRWYAYPCSNSYPGYCEYYPEGKPPSFEADIVMPSGGSCKEGWWRFAGYCYKLMGFNSNVENQDGFHWWNTANTTCSTDGAWPGSSLAMLPSIEHNMLVASLLGYPYGGHNPWVGIYNYAYYDYYFANVNKVKPYVCSHPYDPAYSDANYKYPTEFAFQGLGIDCPKGWMPFRGGCYKYYPTVMDFDSANKKCQDDVKSFMPGAKKGSLITFLDDYEYSFGRSFFRDDQIPERNPNMMPTGSMWIGLKVMERKNKDGDVSKTWSWVDGWPLDIVKWAAGRPENVETTNLQCVVLDKNGFYMDTQCSEQRPFVCKAEYFDFTPSWSNFIDAAGQKYDCPMGWSEVGIHCVRIFGVEDEDQKNWQDARNDCEQRGGDLASIHSSGQNKQYQKLYSDTKLGNRGMWIGLSKRESGFGWTDGSALAYINWAAGEPNNWEGSNEDCVEMFSNGYWNDEQCFREYPYACKVVAPFENCLNAQAYPSGVQSCVGGDTYSGIITEEECMREIGCCWDPQSAIKCYKPKIHIGITVGAAVAGTIFGLLGFGLLGYGYYRYQYGAGTSLGGISNPASLG